MNAGEFRYDIDGLAKELEVDLEDILGLYASYFEEMNSSITELETNNSQENWAMLQRAIHNIKGVSANLRIEDVFVEAEKLDHLLKANSYSEAGDYIKSIIKLIEKAEQDVKNYFNEFGLKM